MMLWSVSAPLCSSKPILKTPAEGALLAAAAVE